MTEVILLPVLLRTEIEFLSAVNKRNYANVEKGEGGLMFYPAKSTIKYFIPFSFVNLKFDKLELHKTYKITDLINRFNM